MTERWRLLATIFLFGGVLLQILAQYDLGASWRLGIEEGARPGLVTTGLYQWCRNPICLGMVATIVGFVVHW
jgi:protein-S-isoprenylcysteine O-methyltransferase Ste14